MTESENSPFQSKTDFRPIESWPGYSINYLGQVRSSFGELLIDHKGRVTLRNKALSLTRKMYVGELLAMAGFCTFPERKVPAEASKEIDDVQERLAKSLAECTDLKKQTAMLKNELKNAEQIIARGRKLNGHLIFLLKTAKTNHSEKHKKNNTNELDEFSSLNFSDDL